MKILIVTQHYWPENFRITDIAETLVSRGHEVTVLTGLPNYPEGYVKPEYKHGKNRSQTHNGVRIVRAFELGRKRNVVNRILNYYSFAHFGTKRIFKLKERYDVVLINELSPIMSSLPGVKYGAKKKIPVIMYEMDVWPEVLTAGGIKKESLVFKHYKKVSGKIYAGCDKILCATEEHIKYIKALPECSNLDILYLPQYAEKLFEEDQMETLDNGIVDFMFAGNVGKAQSVKTIVKAANCLKNDRRFHFHIVGSGSALEDARSLAGSFGLENITFHGRQSLDQMPSYYGLADVMLVTLENKDYASMTLPGKIQSYMSYGKPILASANGATAALIKQSRCGIAVNAEDDAALAEAAKQFLDKNRNIEYGINAKKWYQEHFRKENFMATLEQSITNVKRKSKA